MCGPWFLFHHFSVAIAVLVVAAAMSAILCLDLYKYVSCHLVRMILTYMDLLVKILNILSVLYVVVELGIVVEKLYCDLHHLYA